jgi:hypothetical protein
MWSGGDIDLFIYGLTCTEAQQKLMKIFNLLRRKVMLTAGMDTDVYFVKTPNTLTMGSGSARRDIQIITRLYESKEDILHGFDIDCCCCGFDGNQVLVTPRAAEAIRTKINTVNLSIRGECYEHRLLKYAERGFAIQVPLLERPRLNREHMSFQYEDAFGYRSIGSNGWKKLSEAVGLEKLVLNESLARTCNGMIEYPFPGRQRVMASKGLLDKSQLSFSIKANPSTGGVRGKTEGYGGGMSSKTKSGQPLWPATTRLAMFEHGGAGIWKIEWKEGNMPRKPLSWEEWSSYAYAGRNLEDDCWRARTREREKDRKIKEQAEKKARAMEISQARDEGAREAETGRVQAEAEATAAKSTAAAKSAELARLRSRVGASAVQAAQADEERAMAEAHALAAKAEAASHAFELEQLREQTQGESKAGDDILCIVCCERRKNLMLEPCRHVCLCEECRPGVDKCPLCRRTIKNHVKLFM